MRLSAIILFLFFAGSATQGFCSEHILQTDTIKRNVRPNKTKRHITERITIPFLPKYMIHYEDCVFTHQYTISQRLKKYPFNKAAKILAVSFPGNEPNIDVIINGDKDTAFQKSVVNRIDSLTSGFHFFKDSLGYEQLIEVKELKSSDINRLTDLMFNTKIKRKLPDKYADPGRKCFFPRNALIFFDKNGKEFDRIEICFECLGQRSTSDRLFIGSGCNQEYDLMKKFLISVGVKFGTTIKEYYEKLER